jgi:hypothetical protein
MRSALICLANSVKFYPRRKKHHRSLEKIETEAFIQTWSDADHWNAVEKLFSQSPS